MIEQIKQSAQKYLEQTRSIRRHLHAHPELSFKEYKTAKYIARQLTELGLTPQEGIADTGLVALIKGRNPESRTIALRADIDALPIQEQNDVSYKSTHAGIMHACGHDVHTASMLGACRILHELKDHFEGTIKVIFQPGEEKTPGGASLMIKDGVLKNPAPSGIIGQHVMPYIETGKVGFREGLYMASCDEIYVTVHGKGGHGAMPERNIDPVLISSHLVVALQQIVSRRANPRIPSVLSFGKVTAAGATNVIPEKVELEGTFRTFDEEWRAEAHKHMIVLAENLALSMGGRCEFSIVKGYPFLKNDPELTRRSRTAAEVYMGKENVESLDLWLAAEDFSFYTQEIPGCFYRLGTGNQAKGITSSVHTPTFDIDEQALETGMGLMSWLAVQELMS